MRATVILFIIVWLVCPVAAANEVLFEEQFSGPELDGAVWRSEIVTSGMRWCDTYPGAFDGPGIWVEEGSQCYGVAAHSPYGSAMLYDSMLHLSSDNGQACPYLASRFPGSVQLFPTSGDFVLTIRMRYDRITPWGDGLVVFRTQSTEPSGDNPPALEENVLLQVWADLSGVGGLGVLTSLGGPYRIVATVPSPNALHEYTLECVGNDFTIRVDGMPILGPVESTLRPAAVWMGNPALAYWYPTDWTSFSVDAIRVEVPAPTAVMDRSWGRIKVMYGR